jgi:hypothetical protein
VTKKSAFSTSLFLGLLLASHACSDGQGGSKDPASVATPPSTQASATTPIETTKPVDKPVVALGEESPKPTDGRIESNSSELLLKFAAKVRGESLACYDQSAEMMVAGQIFTDLRIFISNIALVNDKGEDVKLGLKVEDGSKNLQFVDANGNSIALLNYLDAACASSDATKILKDVISGALPSGHYTAIKFQLGLPYPAMDPNLTKIPSALAPTDMAWMWEHFPADFQIETKDGQAKRIVNALTSTKKTIVTLPLDYTHGNAALAPVVQLELSKLFVSTPEAFIKGIENTCVNSTSPLTETSPNCAQVFKALGLPVQNPVAAYEQSAFSVTSRL